MVILESYAAGTPVIASDIGNAGNMVIPGVTGLRFSCGDAKALKEAVIQMEEKRGWDTRSLYEKKYTPERNYELLLEIYNRVQKESEKGLGHR